MEFDVCVVGGCGHVGLPLALTFAEAGLRVSAYDTNDRAVYEVRAGRMPFLEPGAEAVLRDVIGTRLVVANDPNLVSLARHVIVVIGTPVDEHLNPAFNVFRRLFTDLLPLLRDGQCVVLRSTVFPGTTEKVRDIIATSGKDIRVAFCPERVSEGKAMLELKSLPQIVSGCDDEAVRRASDLFGTIAESILILSPVEAELTKIFANVWRYIQFATANQLFMIAAEHGLDFYRIHDALTRNYPRMAGLPTGGFAAGPCLLKDTMQLAASYKHDFWLGHAAMLINEGLPGFLVRMLSDNGELKGKNVGILGMAFKAESDDVRESLSYKLRKLLEFEGACVICSDVYVVDPNFVSVAELIETADIVIVGAPHLAYRGIEFPSTTRVVDIWNLFDNGADLS